MSMSMSRKIAVRFWCVMIAYGEKGWMYTSDVGWYWRDAGMGEMPQLCEPLHKFFRKYPEYFLEGGPYSFKPVITQDIRHIYENVLKEHYTGPGQ